jgi:hypothetical protein
LHQQQTSAPARFPATRSHRSADTLKPQHKVNPCVTRSLCITVQSTTVVAPCHGLLLLLLLLWSQVITTASRTIDIPLARPHGTRET